MTRSHIDPRNTLNDLSGKEWLQFSRSWWFQRGLGKNHPHAAIEVQHPAPFSFRDVQKLTRQFTKPGMTVLDPFCGVASALKAAALCGRNAIGIEISPTWVKLGKSRLREELPPRVRRSVELRIIRGDCLKVLPSLGTESVDFVVTSPPYWRILTKDPDHKTRAARLSKGLALRYSSSPRDLGNVDDYETYLRKLRQVFQACHRVLKKDRYMTVVVSDFRHKADFYPLHMHAATEGIRAGFSLKGVMIMVQNGKQLYPYGYPFAFVQNIHHQYVLVFQRPRSLTHEAGKLKDLVTWPTR